MTTRPRSDQLEVGVTYWPAAVGPYMWHEFPVDTVRRDLAAIASRRIPTVRVMLSWDAFMPTDRAPNPHRMRDLETLLTAARELQLQVVLTLYAQSIGDCVMLPPYAIDRRAPRRGVRCVTDARTVDGGPRDIYKDPLMLEAQVRWLDALLASFASHPAVAAWDLGHDPATTVRPARIVDMVEWTALLAGRVHAQDERCRLTLGQGDVVRGRAVRLDAIAEHVDELGLVVRPQRLPLPGQPLDPDRAVFVAELAQALAGGSAPLVIELGVASGDVDADQELDAFVDHVTAPAELAGRRCDEMLQRLITSGVAGLHSAAWSDWGERLLVAPPGDRRPWLARLGILDGAGVSKPLAQAWESVVSRERTVAVRSPYPASIDVESYYGNLPDSLLDLHASWQGDRSDRPAILD
ncbi:MAG: hypothetical protein M3019_08485 [Candidatus Dormibacteraeota bacterium]|nr:hypothetical protein [Candidatus Dormibacteraeota bacterium]